MRLTSSDASVPSAQPQQERAPQQGLPEGNVPPDHSPDMIWHRYKKYPYLLAKLCFFGAIIFGIYVCLNSVGSVLFPLFVSMLIAYLLDPTIDWFEARKINRTVAILITLVVLLLGLGVFSAVLYPLIAAQVRTVIEKFPGLLDTVQTQFLPWLKTKFNFEIPANLTAAMDTYGAELKSAAPTVFKKAGDWATGLLTQTGVLVSSILNIVMIPLFTFYFLRDFDRMKESIDEYIPLYNKDFVHSRLLLVDEVVGAWFRGQIQVGLILAALYGVGLGGVFAVAGLSMFQGFALGVVSGVLNIVPYLGFAVGIVLSVLVVLIEWTGWGAVIGVGVVFLLVQLAEGYIITPKVVGEKVGLSSVTVIIVLLLGGELAGLLGVLLAIPVAGAIKVILPDLANIYKRSPYFLGHAMPDPLFEAVMMHDLEDEFGRVQPADEPQPVEVVSAPKEVEAAPVSEAPAQEEAAAAVVVEEEEASAEEASASSAAPPQESSAAPKEAPAAQAAPLALPKPTPKPAEQTGAPSPAPSIASGEPDEDDEQGDAS